ncbi:MAG: hypothetical protein ABIY62_02645 [Ginsengibacter sp.]
MKNSSIVKEKKISPLTVYFFAAIIITAASFVYLIKEGQRIKTENELLAYEVW